MSSKTRQRPLSPGSAGAAQAGRTGRGRLRQAGGGWPGRAEQRHRPNRVHLHLGPARPHHRAVARRTPARDRERAGRLGAACSTAPAGSMPPGCRNLACPRAWPSGTRNCARAPTRPGCWTRPAAGRSRRGPARALARHARTRLRHGQRPSAARHRFGQRAGAGRPGRGLAGALTSLGLHGGFDLSPDGARCAGCWPPPPTARAGWVGGPEGRA